MGLSKKVAYNTLVQIIGKIIATVLGLIAVAVMTRYLGQIGFGQYTTIVTFLSFFAVVADLGLTLVTVQLISPEGSNQDEILSNLLGLRLVSAVVFLGLAPLVVLFFPYEPIIKWGVALTSFSFLFAALNQVLVGLFQKNLRLDRVSIAEVASRAVLLGGVIITAYLNRGLWGMLLATITASAVGFLLHFYFSKKFAHISLGFSFSFWRKIIKKSWPLAVTIIFNLIYLRADTLILSLIKGQAEVGIYGATYRVIDILVTLPFIFAGIVLPIMTKSWLENKEGFKKMLQKSFDFMVMLALPLVVGTQFVAQPMMTLVAGKDFAPAGPVLKLLIAAAGIIFVGTMFSHVVIAVDKQKKIIGAYIFTALTSLVGYLVFIPRYSYFGAAGVTIYSELAIALASFYLVWKTCDWLPNLKFFLKSLAASLLMAALLYLVSGANLFALLLLGAGGYFAALYLFGGLTKDDLLIIIK